MTGINSSLKSSSSSSSPYRIAVIGGGTSGVFAAITAARQIQIQQQRQSKSISDDCDGNNNNKQIVLVTIYEAGNEVLRNIRQPTNNNNNILFDPTSIGIDDEKKRSSSSSLREMINMGYPRGKNEVMSLLTKQFPPQEQQTWFEERGITFQTKRDGRMVASLVNKSDDDNNNDSDIDNDNDGENNSSTSSSSSYDIVSNVILKEAIEAGVQIRTKTKINTISKKNNNNNDDDHYFVITTTNKAMDGTNDITIDKNKEKEEEEYCDCIILATGNSHLGFSLATQSFNHTMQRPFSSCFGFKAAAMNTAAAASAAGKKKQQQNTKFHFLIYRRHQMIIDYKQYIKFIMYVLH